MRSSSVESGLGSRRGAASTFIYGIFFFFYGFAKSHFIFMNYPPENRRSNCCVARKVSGNRQDCKFEPN